MMIAMLRFIATAILITGMFAASANASGQGGLAIGKESARFQLWNNCDPIVLSTYINGNMPGISKEKVDAAVRGQLRIARINLSERASSRLLIDISTVPIANNIFIYRSRIMFQKTFADSFTNIVRYAMTYEDLGGGSANSAHEILTLITSKSHTFIENYLRVNADACRNRN